MKAELRQGLIKVSTLKTVKKFDFTFEYKSMDIFIKNSKIECEWTHFHIFRIE